MSEKKTEFSAQEAARLHERRRQASRTEPFHKVYADLLAPVKDGSFYRATCFSSECTDCERKGTLVIDDEYEQATCTACGWGCTLVRFVAWYRNCDGNEAATYLLEKYKNGKSTTRDTDKTK